eukprot:m.345250 g.345250  ORF g.345250 m.345250 type:complete len:184 (+) comp20661_c0_seq3:602-1153(+)
MFVLTPASRVQAALPPASLKSALFTGTAQKSTDDAGKSSARSRKRVEFYDVVVSRDKKKSRYSDISCNGIPLDRMQRLAIDESSGFTKRNAPKVQTALRKGHGRPGPAVDSDDDDDDAIDPSPADDFDLYLLPEDGDLFGPGIEFEFVHDDSEVRPVHQCRARCRFVGWRVWRADSVSVHSVS